MFGLGKKAAVLVAVSKVPVPTKQPATVALDDKLIEEYRRVSEEIGFSTPALLEARLAAFFTDNHMDVYSYKKVVAFLDDQFGRPQFHSGGVFGYSHYKEKTWCWCPLRAIDAEKRLWAHTPPEQNGEIITGVFYQLPVPLPVLHTVKQVSAAFPEVAFFVSKKTEDADKADPFLMVTAQGISNFVIERWDEPSFRL